MKVAPPGKSLSLSSEKKNSFGSATAAGLKSATVPARNKALAAMGELPFTRLVSLGEASARASSWTAVGGVVCQFSPCAAAFRTRQRLYPDIRGSWRRNGSSMAQRVRMIRSPVAVASGTWAGAPGARSRAGTAARNVTRAITATSCCAATFHSRISMVAHWPAGTPSGPAQAVPMAKAIAGEVRATRRRAELVAESPRARCTSPPSLWASGPPGAVSP